MLEKILLEILRAAFAYLLLLTVARLMGRKALSQMTYFDFAVIITLGSVTADLALGQDSDTITDITALLTLGGLAILTGILHIKSARVRKLVNSEPIMAIHEGQIVNQNLTKARFTVDELMSMLRQKDVFSCADVDYALFESNGQISVLLKPQKSPLTPADMRIDTGMKGLTKDLVIDGAVLEENLHSTGRTLPWLMEKLGESRIDDISQVFYAGLDSSGMLYVSQKKNSPEEAHGQYGLE